MAALHVTLLSRKEFSWAMAVGFLTASTLALGYSHAMRGVAQRLRWTRRTLRGLSSRIVLSCVLGGGVITSGAFLVEGAAFSGEGVPREAGRIAFIVAYWTVLLLLWSGVYLALYFFRESRVAEVERWKLMTLLREAELDSLKSQLDPHFMFNALNSIRGLVAENPERAREMVTELAGILRYALRVNRSETVPLEEELRMVSSYFELEAMRLEERLHFSLDIEDDVASATVPPMIIQTLVENAIKHGVAKLVDGGWVRVEARSRNGLLSVRIENSGHLGDTDEKGGIGLQNARERLRLLHGDAARLELREREPGLVVAEIEMPLENTHESAHR